MPSRSRRILYRAGFLTFCLFPTLALAGWIVNARVIEGAASPAADDDARPLAEAELSRLVGLKVNLQAIAYPPSGYTVLEGMTIADPETGERIAFVPVLELARGKGGLVMTATRPEIDAGRWSALWETIHDRVLRERGEKMAPIDLTASQVTLVSDRNETLPTLTDVEVRLEPGKAAIEFRIAGSEAPHRARLQAVRDRTASPPITRCELDTGGAEFPCILFAKQTPWLAHLGKNCVFDGSLWYEEAADGRRGEVTGRLQRIDLERLVGNRFPHIFSGEANVMLTRADFAGGRLRSASGAMEAGPGTISGDLLGEAIGQFELRYTPELGSAIQPLMRYEQLKLGFTISDGGLQISGRCDPEGTILSLETKPKTRVFDWPGKTAPVVSLVRVLAPASEATLESDGLLRMLPLPALNPPPPPGNAPPQARVRMPE